jgi:hypothetical protein
MTDRLRLGAKMSSAAEVAWSLRQSRAEREAALRRVEAAASALRAQSNHEYRQRLSEIQERRERWRKLSDGLGAPVEYEQPESNDNQVLALDQNNSSGDWASKGVSADELRKEVARSIPRSAEQKPNQEHQINDGAEAECTDPGPGNFQQVERLLEELGPHCTNEDLSDLVEYCESIRDAGKALPAAGLRDFRVRIESAARKGDELVEVRVERAALMVLIEGLEESPRLDFEWRIKSAVDLRKLRNIRQDIEESLENKRIKQTLPHVTEAVISSLEDMGYVVGAPFEDLLSQSTAQYLVSSRLEDYALKVSIPSGGNVGEGRINIELVRNTASGHRDERAVLATCQDLSALQDRINSDSVGSDWDLDVRITHRRVEQVQSAVNHWPQTEAPTESILSRRTLRSYSMDKHYGEG